MTSLSSVILSGAKNLAVKAVRSEILRGVYTERGECAQDDDSGLAVKMTHYPQSKRLDATRSLGYKGQSARARMPLHGARYREGRDLRWIVVVQG